MLAPLPERSGSGNGFVSGVLHREELRALRPAFSYAANRPAGTREALPGSMIAPSKRSDVAELAPRRSFEIASRLEPQSKTGCALTTKVIRNKTGSSVR
jgi:hypothetical protein